MTPRRLTAPVLAVCTALVVAGCGGGADDPGTSTKAAGVVVEVPADGETQPTQHSGDSADDPAIWVNHDDPAKSLVIGNDKKGALETYDLDGTLVQRITAESEFWGNVDVRQDVQLSNGLTDVVAAANSGVRVYAVDEATRKLSPITVGGKPLDTGGGEGVCLYNDKSAGLSVFMVNISGDTRQYALEDDGSGQLSAKQVRHFKVGSEAEGCVVDDENKALYIDEENVGTWKYDADPAGGDKRTLIDAIKPKGHQIPDIEGITLVTGSGGSGYLIASSQGLTDKDRSYFAVFDRRTGDYEKSFRIVDGKNADGCTHTDGIAATSEPLGPDFPDGVFICQDDNNTAPGESGNQSFKLTRLEKVRP